MDGRHASGEEGTSDGDGSRQVEDDKQTSKTADDVDQFEY